MTIAREEIFGPVLAAIEFEDVDEAIASANDTPYGLAAGVWTRDIKKAHYVARKLQAGTVWVNTYNVYDTAAPFGGYKQSGFGREMSAHALEHYTQIKSGLGGPEYVDAGAVPSAGCRGASARARVPAGAVNRGIRMDTRHSARCTLAPAPCTGTLALCTLAPWHRYATSSTPTSTSSPST